MRGQVLFLEPKGTILEVVREAKKRGYEVTALVSDNDILKNLPPPYDSARGCIDQIIEIKSWEDRNEVLTKAEALDRKEPISGIYFGIDPCAVVGALLRKRFSLPSPAPEVMELILDKRRLRMRLATLQLSKLKSIPDSEADLWTHWEIGKAAYFKPVHGSFSMFVKRCENLEDLKQARGAWKQGAKDAPKYVSEYLNSNPTYHLEEEISGELMSVEAICHQGQFKCVGLTSRILFSKDPTVEMGSCFPYPHPLAEKIIDLVRRAHIGLGFSDGPTHTEVIVSPRNEIEIVDFNPRFIGADVLQSINHAYGIRIEESLVDWATGTEPNVKPRESQFSCIQYVLPPEPLTFESMTFPSVPEVKFATYFPVSGTKVLSTERQIDYLGCYLTVQPGFTKAIERSRELRKEVKINQHLMGAY